MRKKRCICSFSQRKHDVQRDVIVFKVCEMSVFIVFFFLSVGCLL